MLDTKTANLKLAALREAIRTQGLDAYLVLRSDCFGGEEVRAQDERLAWLTGFTGSAGLAIIGLEQAALFIDGRYTIQAAQEVGNKLYTLCDIGTIETWLKQNWPFNCKIGYDPHLMMQNTLTNWQKRARLVPCFENLIDQLWKEKPKAVASPLWEHPIQWAGISREEKVKQLKTWLLEQKFDALFVAAPDETAWLLNIRAGSLTRQDLQNTPISLSRAVITKEGEIILFSDAPNAQDFARTNPLAALPNWLASFNGTLAYDPVFTSVSLASHIKQGSQTSSPLTKMKALKNPSELAGMRKAQYEDGLIMARFLSWLDQQPPGTQSEQSAAQTLDTLRREHPDNLGLSFATISAFGANAALPHYRVTEQSNAVLHDGLYLMDSGGQYRYGTTDITRTRLLGQPHNLAELKRMYTLVLKGHLALARQRFPKGTSGQALDSLARAVLWQEGYDFEHGTGHGVGAVLHVHEGPQRIAKRMAEAVLEPGMILSNEPGYYRKNAFGIRIETLLAVIKKPLPQDEYDMLGFEVLTLAPYEHSLIDKTLLGAEERAQVRRYHDHVYEMLSSGLDAQTRAWLATACSAF